MLRRQFTNLLAERAGLRKWQAEEFMRVFPEVLAEVLLQEKKQTLVGFGSFELKDIPERKLESRLLGETYELESYKRVCFKASDLCVLNFSEVMNLKRIVLNYQIIYDIEKRLKNWEFREVYIYKKLIIHEMLKKD